MNKLASLFLLSLFVVCAISRTPTSARSSPIVPCTAVFAPAALVPATLQGPTQWNRKVKNVVNFATTGTPNQYSASVSMGVVNGTPTILDFGADITVLVNGAPSASTSFIVSAGESDGGCTPCPSSTCAAGQHRLSACEALSGICRCDAVIRGGVLLSALFPGDLVRVELSPRPGAVPEQFVSDDFYELIFTGAEGAFCAGDASGVACPCGNNSPAWNYVGCLNSLGMGAGLTAAGSASISSDTFVLAGSDMPNSSALYFQGTTQQSGGAGAAFGDGLRCVSGSVVRLGTKTNVGGASQYPALGDLAVSVRGGVLAPGTRYYQIWYRNAASFCTPSTFNLSNGWLTVWNP